MAGIRVHELAKELGRPNREVIEALKANGVDVKSHMSRLEESHIRMIKEKFSQMGKEQIAKVENSRTEEKVVTSKPDTEKAEAPKKKKNIIRVYHAQNASDGGKNRPKRPAGDKRPAGARPARPQGAKRPADTAARKPAEAVKKPVEQPVKKPVEQAKVSEIKTADVKAAEVKVSQTAAPAQTAEKSVQTKTQSGESKAQGRPARENRDGRERSRDFRSGDRKQGERGTAQQGGRAQKPADSRSSRTGEGTARQTGRGQGRSQGAQGRPVGRNDGKFSGSRSGQRQGGRRGDNEAVFTPELTKTSKDSKRERDRENKNKKKDFDKMAGGGHRPNQGGRRTMSRLPKALQKPAPQPKQEEKKPEVKEITLPEKLTIRELADAMKMQPSVIVKKLFMQGIMVTVNQEIDFEKAQEIALEYDIIAEPEEKVDVIGELLKEEEEDEADMVPRPPVVCVMGHVDHGKTSLLDAIRHTNVTRGEAGGITQHIGAYVVEINGQKITFLDTPGHEAFTAMRMRGADATDIAVLVVAADDGVMPQTVEAISHAKAAGVEIIVAINKVDKPSANIERVKQELSEYELIPEDWGGSTVCVPVSAHTGEGINNLLEMILLTAEVAELKANPNRAARGLVIEAQLDKGKGPVATILVQKGTLHVGDFIAAGACSGKVRAMMDDKGRRVKEAGPSTPVEILGLGDVPNAGEILMSFASDKEAKNFAAAFVSENKNRLLEETKGKLSLDNLFDQIQASDLKELPIIVKADVQGSVEAVKQSLVKLSNDEVVVRVIHGGVGAVNESDVSLASTSNAIIIGFNVRPDAMAKQLAEQEGVDLRLYRVIYQAIEDVEAAMKGMLDPVYEEKVIGHAEVRQTFKASGVGTIAGSYVLDGIFQRNCKVRITREGEQIFEGELASLKRFKDDVKEVKAGYECGLVFEGFNDVKEEDQIEAYIMVEVPR
ncbi:MAG: translation initiation factor IF-2 [Blautia sp.]